MSESVVNESATTFRPYSGTIRTNFAAAANRPVTVEFVGASDDTIADAVRRALARASASLLTLEGAGVVVIPEVYRVGPAPRYRVTLQVTAAIPSADTGLGLPPLLLPHPR